MVGVGHVALHQLLLHQVLHPADLHLVRVVHQAGPDAGLVRAVHRLWLDGDAGGGRVVVRRGHAVAAVTEAKAFESGRNVGAGEGSPAAFARHWPEVSVNLWVERTAGTVGQSFRRDDYSNCPNYK